MNMKIAIFGAAGGVGSALQQLCATCGIEFLAMNRAAADITNLQQLRYTISSAGITHIVNCAAYTNVDLAETEQATAFAVNAQGAENLSLIALENNLKLLHLSSDYVFDGDKKTPYTVSDLCNPLGVYGSSKREGEIKVLEVNPSACVLRTSWVFGRSGKNFISSLLQIMKDNAEVSVVADQRGRPTFSDDLAKAIVQLLCSASVRGIFHFANQGDCSRYEMAQEIFSFAKNKGINIACKKVIPVSSDHFATRAKRPLYSVLDTSKIEALLPPLRPWKIALNEYLGSIC